MGDVPPVRWAATSDGVSLAFQVFGDGPVDVVIIPPFAQNVELAWERPEMRRVFAGMSRFARVVHFDKRGTGVSDRTARVPGLDQRVDDTRAVMDAAGVERCVLYGLSEGGPMAILFAVTYPERVDRLVLHATDARIVDLDGETVEQRERRRWGTDGLFAAWGTDETRLLERLAPTAWADPGYRAWEPRYQRHCATPAAIRELLAMIDEIDVREVLAKIDVPTLVLHVRGDPVIPIERVRVTAAAIPGARLVEHDGVDHFPHVGEVDWWLDELELFVTGRPPEPRPALPVGRTRIVTFGGFDVIRDGRQIALAEWGSRRARTLCKRLAAAAGEPVPREQLIELLWPDGDDANRLSARLSVQLSTVRRLLGGGVIADRDSVRLDLTEVDLDLVELHRSIRDGRDDDAIELHHGEFLPEEAYAEWAIAPRDRARNAVLRALRRCASAPRDADAVIALLQHALTLDPYAPDAHEQLIALFHDEGRLGEAARAHDRYTMRMAELDVVVRPLAEITGDD
ncbi:MAG: alpha/beta fold hydrolase [Ilumatobacteraceae bacterium]